MMPFPFSLHISLGSTVAVEAGPGACLSVLSQGVPAALVEACCWAAALCCPSGSALTLKLCGLLRKGAPLYLPVMFCS